MNENVSDVTKNPTGPGTNRHKSRELDLNDTTIAKVHAGGRFMITREQHRKWEALKAMYKLNDSQMTARIVGGYLDKLL